MPEKQLSTPANSETWVVVCDKEKFSLNEKQIAVVKQATTKGQRGLIWFDTFAISIPHISSIYRSSVRSKEPEKLPEHTDSYYESPEYQAKTRASLNKIKQNLGDKLSFK